MDLLTYISEMPRRIALADACGTSPEYLWQIATRWRGKRPSPELAALIEQESDRLGPEKVAKEPMIFGAAAATARTEARALINIRLSKRALRARLGLSSDAHLAKVLGLPVDEVSGWADEDMVPALPQVMKLLGHTEQQEPAKPANDDPDADRIGPIDTA